MKIVSVNVGMPREVVWKGMTVWTGIFKEPDDGPVMISELNLAGDRQANLTVQGGAQKAVYAYPAEHYEDWRNELPQAPFSWGVFGENLTIEGLRDDTLCIGDPFRVGSAVLMVTRRLAGRLVRRNENDGRNSINSEPIKADRSDPSICLMPLHLLCHAQQ